MLNQTFLFLGQLWQLFEVSQILEFLRLILFGNFELNCCSKSGSVDSYQTAAHSTLSFGNSVQILSVFNDIFVFKYPKVLKYWDT